MNFTFSLPKVSGFYFVADLPPEGTSSGRPPVSEPMWVQCSHRYTVVFVGHSAKRVDANNKTVLFGDHIPIPEEIEIVP